MVMCTSTELLDLLRRFAHEVLKTAQRLVDTVQLEESHENKAYAENLDDE